ncbi:hypothetical protein AZI86_14345 [Bdellovibrio bacteriovorus]|uniref:Uncharacterized protein n=1 Tax=Bdellovibrio bacteriovorus TaxID=959 RepID=A0A150WJU6_BDEBC|nr:hypothetical protein [Bdellovibrio bacteriovorus]KYG63986.1 hypothetical protein AZI86_14345 [Bdellovibrio bacteriovorus]
MKNDKLKKVLESPNDLSGLRLSRRELLETGVISFAARIAVPGAITSILTMASRAEAQVAGSMMPFVTLSLSGGAALHGNFVVKNAGGGLLGTYSKLGLGKAGFGTEKVMGADFASSSQLHKGIQSVASAQALAKARLVALCTNTANDTAGQAALRPFYDLSGPLEKAGLIGKILPGVHQGSGQENIKPVFGSPNSMLDMASLDTMFGALNYSSVLADNGLLSKTQKDSLARFVGKMTSSQIGKINTKNTGLKTVLQEAGIKSGDIIAAGGASGVDPRKDANVQAVYKIAANTAVNNTTAVSAGVVYNALNGNISHGRITLGGYDYHAPGLRSAADTKDFNAGVQIGNMIELASRMNKPLFILVTTDGACSSETSDTSSSIWSSDYSSSLQFMIAFDPSGALTSSGSQVGHYLEDQSVDTTTLVGSRPDYVAAAVLANYLNLNKKLGLFKQLAPATLQSDDLDKVVKLHKA